MSKRVLITGGAGFIGSHLADELLQQGYQVRALNQRAGAPTVELSADLSPEDTAAGRKGHHSPE